MSDPRTEIHYERWLATLTGTDHPLPPSLEHPPSALPARRRRGRLAAAAAVLLAAGGAWHYSRADTAPRDEQTPVVRARPPVLRLERIVPIEFERRVATIHLADEHTIESVQRTHAAGLDEGE